MFPRSPSLTIMLIRQKKKRRGKKIFDPFYIGFYESKYAISTTIIIALWVCEVLFKKKKTPTKFSIILIFSFGNWKIALKYIGFDWK